MSDERFSPGKLLCYLRGKKSLWFIIAAFVLGLALLIFGGRDGRISVTSGCTALEARLQSFCEQVGGVSGASVLVNLDSDGNVRGIAVVCSGGDDPVVQLKLTRLLCSLFGITSDAVSVIGGGQ